MRGPSPRISRRARKYGAGYTVLGAINLVDLARSDLMYAAALPGRLRSADAIHLAAAIRLQSDAMAVYDATYWPPPSRQA
ncbi:UNVERIFIED_ORG: putative nucleic acid-binding protein [Arthrobacter sp. UYCu721]